MNVMGCDHLEMSSVMYTGSEDWPGELTEIIRVLAGDAQGCKIRLNSDLEGIR